MPQLQPAVALSHPPAFFSPRKAHKRSDAPRQAVLGVTASSGSPGGLSKEARLTAAISRAASTGDPDTIRFIVPALALLVLLAASVLVRRRAGRAAYVSAGAAPIAMAAPAAPVAEPEPEPAQDHEPEPAEDHEPEYEPTPPPVHLPAAVPPPSPKSRRANLHRVARPAAIAASGLLSLAVSRLLRGRRRR
jgi:hypothetical protein